MEFFKIFSDISNLNLGFVQTRKNLPLALVIYFRVYQDFNNPSGSPEF